MEEMERLKVQLEQPSDFAEGTQLVVAELAEKLEKRVRDVEAIVGSLRQAVRGHTELSVLQGGVVPAWYSSHEPGAVVRRHC